MPKKFCFCFDLKIGSILFGIILIPISIAGIWFCLSAKSKNLETAYKECDHIYHHASSSEYEKCFNSKNSGFVGYILLIISLCCYTLFYIVTPCCTLRLEKLDEDDNVPQIIVVFCLLLSVIPLIVTIFPWDVVDIEARFISLAFVIAHIYYCCCLHSRCKKYRNKCQGNEETDELKA